MRKIIALMSIMALLACTSTNVMQTTKQFSRPTVTQTVVLMEPDIQLGELKAGGMVEPRADWTTTATLNIKSNIRQTLMNRNHKFIENRKNTELPVDQLQIVKLHGAVGDTIVAFKLGAVTLPTKRSTFDWSLGPGVRAIGQAQKADYALFVNARGSYASAGRVATMIVVAALFGASVPLGQQVAFASLVDLKTGDVVWFNVAGTGESNDLRKTGGSKDLVAALLKDIPL